MNVINIEHMYEHVINITIVEVLRKQKKETLSFICLWNICKHNCFQTKCAESLVLQNVRFDLWYLEAS